MVGCAGSGSRPPGSRVAAVRAAGCGDAPSSPSDYAPYSQIDLVFGEGDSAETGKVLTVNYTGWFYDSTKPDKKGVQLTTSPTPAPRPSRPGANSVIEGWERGVLGMKEGGIRRLIIRRRWRTAEPLHTPSCRTRRSCSTSNW